MSRPWLVNGSQLIATALVFAHSEQIDRLARDVPEALDTAFLGGDPCLDRMLDSLRLRRKFRRALGVDNRKLVVISSTWSTNSLIGAGPELIRKLSSELPLDEFQIALIPHPNAWNRHGHWQIRWWFADAIRAGLVLIPPDQGWQAALIAADCVIGDQGSVTAYAAAIDRPTMLAVFPSTEVVDDTAVALLGRLAPRLLPSGSLSRQVRAAIDNYVPDQFREVAALANAVPGESPQRLRQLCYRLLGLAEPPNEVVLLPLTTAGLTARPGSRADAMLVFTEWDETAGELRVDRFAADTRPFVDTAPTAATTHTAVDYEHPVRGLRHTADIVFGSDSDTPTPWLTETLADHPASTLAALVFGSFCWVRHRDGEQVLLQIDDDTDASVLASAAYWWRTNGNSLAELPTRFLLRVGGRRSVLTVRPDPPVIRQTRRSGE